MITNLKKLAKSDGLFKDGDWIEKKDQDPEGEVRLIQLADIGDNRFLDKSSRFLTKKRAIELNCTFLRKGDILISRLGEPLGKACVFPLEGDEKYITAVDVCIFRSPIVNTKWLVNWLNSPQFRTKVDEYKSGTTRKRVSRKNLEKIDFEVFESDVQQKIVDKIEELFSVIESVTQSLTYVKKATTNLGNKLLFDSFTGKLTGDWRESNRAKETGIELVKKYTQSLIADSTLPSTWARVKVGDVFGVYVGSTPSRKEKSYWGGDIPWVSSGEVSFCRIKETKETITQLGYDNSSTKIHPVGTVLLGMIGEGKTRGQVAILDIEATHNQNSAAIRVSETDVLPEYVYYFFQSEYQKTRQIGSGNNQKALNKTRVSEIEIPIPPVEEQQVIVELLGAYFSNLEAIKKDLALSKEVKIQSLRQSILKKAFEGKLV